MHKSTLMLGIAAALSMFAASAHAVATAEPADLDPDVLAKLAQHRAKASTLNSSTLNNRAAASGRGSSANGAAGVPGADCGALAIGNVANNRIGFAPREVNVIITGDVINANNNCR